MINFLQAYALAHPLLTLFIYILVCFGFGIGIVAFYHFIRKKIDIAKTMKRRAANDKSR